jgi:hypothetical protein
MPLRIIFWQEMIAGAAGLTTQQNPRSQAGRAVQIFVQMEKCCLLFFFVIAGEVGAHHPSVRPV